MVEGNSDMARRRGQRKGYLRADNGSWLLTYRVYARECPAGKRHTVTIGPADGPGKLTKKQAERFAFDHYLQKLDTSVLKPLSTLTVAEFWDKKYEPHLRKNKKYATQIQYISLWSTWLKPVCGNVRFYQLSPDHIDRSMANALAAGKSTATAKHIRKVASAVWSHAKRMQCASGDNPAQAIEAITVEPVRSIRALGWSECKTLLAALPEPVRTMALIGLALSPNVSEMVGLREKHVNFSDSQTVIDGADMVPPHCIAVREQVYHGRRGSLKTGKRRRNLPMSTAVEAALQSLIRRNASRGPDAPVFQTSTGTSQSADNLNKRVLRKVAEKLGISGVTWHVLRHTHATLTKGVGMSDYDRQRLMGHASVDMTDRYTHVDQERVRAGVEKVTDLIFPVTVDQGIVQ